jgi:signal peptidase I
MDTDLHPTPAPSAPTTPAGEPMNRLPGADPAEAVFALVRQTIEFLVVLCLCILTFRSFAAEAYIVPTGSMAPTLVGQHRAIVCTNCRFHFVLGADDQGRSGRPVCPNCGQYGGDSNEAEVAHGDRLLVQKFFFDLRAPRRWEVAVFQSRIELNQAYVKRVVGLPGEAIQIRGGDVYIDGRIARKSFDEVRATRQLVYDNNFVPADSNRFPRWAFRRGPSRGAAPSGWRVEGTRLVHEPSKADGPTVDWVDYLHWDPDTGRYGPIRDFTTYNGGDLRAENLVHDLMLDLRVSARPDAKSLAVRFNPGSDLFLLKLPIDGSAPPEVRWNGKLLETTGTRRVLASSSASAPRWQRLEVGVVDRRLLVAIDGSLAFDPIDLGGAGGGPGRFERPVSIGVPGGSAELADVKLYRDVYYTSALAGTPRRPFGVDTPYVLGADEYFVLGDNSPVSNDSRFWPGGPVVRRRDFLGKPFLVHLPGQVALLQVLGRTICRIPDPREIRYIR